MQFFTVAALLAATAMAVPVTGTTEVVTAREGTFRRDSNENLIGISFTMKSEASDDLISCSVNNPVQGDLHPCDNAEYTFGLVEKVSYARFKLTIYHATSDFAGLNGNITMGCNGPLFTVCSLIGSPTTTLCSDLNVCGDLADN